MGVLAWLGIPAAATVIAIVWVQWSARPRGPVETQQSLAEHERFKAAMAKPAVTQRSARRLAAARRLERSRSRDDRDSRAA